MMIMITGGRGMRMREVEGERGRCREERAEDERNVDGRRVKKRNGLRLERERGVGRERERGGLGMRGMLREGE